MVAAAEAGGHCSLSLWEDRRLLVRLVELSRQLRRHLGAPNPGAACVADLRYQRQPKRDGREGSKSFRISTTETLEGREILAVRSPRSTEAMPRSVSI